MTAYFNFRMYEAHLPVSDVKKSIEFYENIVGLELAHEDAERNIAFLWVGDKDQGMLGLWGPGSPFGPKPGQSNISHFAISVPLEALLKLPQRLKGMGVNARGFGDTGEGEPSVIGWMPSAQIYFADPDGNSVEFISILDEEPDPEFIGKWSDWKGRKKKSG